MKYYVNCVLVFLIIFDLQVPGLPNKIGSSFVVASFLLALFFAAPSFFRIRQSLDILRPFLIVHLLIFLYSVIRILAAGAADISYILAVAKSLSLFSAFFLYISLKSNQNFSDLPRLLLNLYFANAVVCFVAGSDPDLLSYIQIFQGETLTDTSMISYRNAFLSGSGFFSIGTAYGLFFLFACKCILDSVLKVTLFNTLQLVLVGMAGFIAARTSIFAMMCGILLLVMRRNATGIYISVILLTIIFTLISSEEFGVYNAWLFPFFIEGDNGGSFDEAKNMYYLPETMTLFFGDGRHNTSEGFYGETDVGYMRNILFGGIGFVFLIFSFLIIFIAKSLKFDWLFSSLIALSIIVFHGKGPYIYNNAQGMAIFYFIFVYVSFRKWARN